MVPFTFLGMNNINEAPMYRKEANYIFFCDFGDEKGDCIASVNGPNRWKYVKALGGETFIIFINSML